MNFSYVYCGECDKTDWNALFKECFPFDNVARQHMIQAITEVRKREVDTNSMTPHHIIPRCFYAQKNLPVDSTPQNLIYLTQEEHLWFHCCCVSCCNYNIKPKLKHPVIAMLGYWKDAQKVGIENAIAAGVKFGRRAISKPEESVWKPLIDQVNNGAITATKAMNVLNMKRTTFYKLFRNDLKCVPSQKAMNDQETETLVPQAR